MFILHLYPSLFLLLSFFVVGISRVEHYFTSSNPRYAIVPLHYGYDSKLKNVVVPETPAYKAFKSQETLYHFKEYRPRFDLSNVKSILDLMKQETIPASKELLYGYLKLTIDSLSFVDLQRLMNDDTHQTEGTSVTGDQLPFHAARLWTVLNDDDQQALRAKVEEARVRPFNLDDFMTLEEFSDYTGSFSITVGNVTVENNVIYRECIKDLINYKKHQQHEDVEDMIAFTLAGVRKGIEKKEFTSVTNEMRQILKEERLELLQVFIEPMKKNTHDDTLKRKANELIYAFLSGFGYEDYYSLFVNSEYEELRKDVMAHLTSPDLQEWADLLKDKPARKNLTETGTP